MLGARYRCQAVPMRVSLTGMALLALGHCWQHKARGGDSTCTPIQHLFIVLDSSSPVRRDHGCCRGNPNLPPGRLRGGPVPLRAGPQSMGTDGYPSGVGAEGPHRAGSVQGHHAGLSPRAGGAGGGGRADKAGRGDRSVRTWCHCPTVEGLTTPPSQPALARGPGGARAKPHPAHPAGAG